MRRRLAWCALCAAMALMVTPAVQAQVGWPSRPIRIIMQSPPGGSMDLIARLVQAPLQESFGQPVVIESRTGGMGIIALEAVLKAADGHTFCLISTTHAALPSLHDRLPFDTLRDFTAVALLIRSPDVIAVNPATPIHTIADLVANAKARPGALSYGHSGVATGEHIVGEAFKQRAGIDMVQVPYRGAGPAMLAAMGGEIPVVLAVAGGMVQHIRSGKLRPLAVTGGERLAILPDVPTVEEQGFPGFRIEQWFGVVGPAGTPAHVARSLNRELNRAIQVPAVAERLRALGYQAVAESPDQFRAYIESETKKTRAIIESAKIRVE